MKKALFCMFLAFMCEGLFAQQPVVAVAPFDAISGVSSTEANMITRVFFIRLGNTNKVSLVDRSVVERVLREHAFQAGDWSDQQKTAELGTALNADWIVRGEMEKFGSTILVTVQFYDIKTFRFMGGADLRLANADEAYDKMDPLVDRLVETISGSPASGGRSGGAASGAGGSARGAPAGFVLVPAGTFSMGSGNGDSDEKPMHQVTISKAFYMSDHEVTQKEWVEVMGNNPSNWKGDDLPVEQVSWFDAIEYCNKRSIREGLMPAYSGSGEYIRCDFKASGYRLPTEAEWEWAAKGGGKDFMVYEYSGSNSVDGVAWHSGNSGGQTHPVKTKGKNSLGLYDMSGNVWEWCWDWYEAYSSGSQTDPSGAAAGSYRVPRGGSWDYDAQILRSAYRYGHTPSDGSSDVGFRLVRP
ncbi:MAG: formylglycine-generating enzyme family protein [Treponema sp.]|jgi:formylglycine-generating enzyme required for sulfatase activity|nr:formylglycine-generating enzyme family protein [Treponema sp.]